MIAHPSPPADTVEPIAEPFLAKAIEALADKSIVTAIPCDEAARAIAEAIDGQRRADFLAAATTILSTSFDQETTLSRVARLAVPYLADYAVVEQEGAEGLDPIGAAHTEPSLEATIRELHRELGRRRSGRHPVRRAIRSGRAILIEDLEKAGMMPAEDSDLWPLVARLEPRCAIYAPVRGDGRTVAAFTLVGCASSGRTLGREQLVLAQDLARRAALAIQSARVFRQAQEATAARDHVLAVVAHDLRNPIHTIGLATELMETACAEPQVVRAAQIVRRAVDDMRALIEDLLDVQRIEQGSLPIERRPHDLGSVIREAAAMFAPAAEHAGLTLSFRCGREIGTVVLDRRRILQLLSNLLGNAIKFTPRGGEVAIEAEQLRDRPGSIRISVSDTGPGIPRPELANLFRRFWQGERDDRRGIGLGLSIARAVAEAHGGRIWAESTVGKGSTFVVELPVIPGRAEAEPG